MDTEGIGDALHGLVMLDRGGRLREDLRQQRLAVLVDQFLAVPN